MCIKHPDLSQITGVLCSLKIVFACALRISPDFHPFSFEEHLKERLNFRAILAVLHVSLDTTCPSVSFLQILCAYRIVCVRNRSHSGLKNHASEQFASQYKDGSKTERWPLTFCHLYCY